MTFGDEEPRTLRDAELVVPNALQRFKEIVSKKQQAFEEILDGDVIDHTILLQIERKMTRADSEMTQLIEILQEKFTKARNAVKMLQQVAHYKIRSSK